LCVSPEIIRRIGWAGHVECTVSEEHRLRVFVEGGCVDGEGITGGWKKKLQI